MNEEQYFQILKEGFCSFKENVLDSKSVYSELCEAFDKALNKKDYMSEWFFLKNEYLPYKIGKQASDFLIDILLNRSLPPNHEQYIEKEDRIKCTYLIMFYSDFALESEVGVISPYKLIYHSKTYNDSANSYTLHLHRADGNKFRIQMNRLEMVKFLHEYMESLYDDFKRSGMVLDQKLIKNLESTFRKLKELKQS